MSDWSRTDLPEADRAAADSSGAEILVKILQGKDIFDKPGPAGASGDTVSKTKNRGQNLDEASEQERFKPVPGDNNIVVETVDDSGKVMLAQKAESIAGIIDRTGDFYAGLKRQRLESDFNDATRAGESHLRYLVDRINDNLKNRDLRLSCQFWHEKVSYRKDPGITAIYQQPIIVPEHRSVVQVENLRTGQIEDRISSSPAIYGQGYFRLNKEGHIELDDAYQK